MALFKNEILDLKEFAVKNEQELIALVNKINTDIKAANHNKNVDDKEKLLDLNYLLKRYRTIMSREKAKFFWEAHDCYYCLYYEKPRKCFVKTDCPLEEGKDFEEEVVVEKRKCPKDIEGNCPYGNEVGTCFGFCIQKIAKEFKEERKNGK